MKTTTTTTIMRWTAGAACLTLVLCSLVGCSDKEDGDEDGNDQAVIDSPSSAGEAKNHDGDVRDDDNDEANGKAHHDDEDDKVDGEHGDAVEYAAPQTYAHAVEAIHAQLEKIEKLLATQGLDRVHAEAAVIRDIANVIAQLALKEGSGVPREAVREINQAAKNLAAKFGPIDEAGDSDDLAGTQKIYDEMIALFETLEKYAPDHDDDDDKDEANGKAHHDDDDH